MPQYKVRCLNEQSKSHMAFKVEAESADAAADKVRRRGYTVENVELIVEPPQPASSSSSSSYTTMSLFDGNVFLGTMVGFTYVLILVGVISSIAAGLWWARVVDDFFWVFVGVIVAVQVYVGHGVVLLLIRMVKALEAIRDAKS